MDTPTSRAPRSRTNLAATPPVEVAILALRESSASAVFGMFDQFKSAGRDWGLIVDGQPGPELMRPRIVARQLEPFAVGNDVMICPHALLEQAVEPQVVCVPELMVPPGERIAGRFDAEVDWLRRCHARGAMIATACSGALLLAESGLLDGCEATTHWAYCDALKRHYPAVDVRTQRALVVAGEGGRLIMAGGGTSYLDLSLFLIARTVSVEAAMQVARVNLINWHDVGQQPFARLARSAQSDDAVIARCQVWIAQHYDEEAPVAAMARLSGLAERSFKRRFKLATGMAPLEYVHALRLEEAKQMLEATDLPNDRIAREIGYEDAGFFARLFRRHISLSPAQYRKRFGGMRRALGGAPNQVSKPLTAAPSGTVSNRAKYPR